MQLFAYAEKFMPPAQVLYQFCSTQKIDWTAVLMKVKQVMETSIAFSS